MLKEIAFDRPDRNCDVETACIVWLQFEKDVRTARPLRNVFEEVEEAAANGHAVVFGDPVGLPVAYALWAIREDCESSGIARLRFSGGRLDDETNAFVLDACAIRGYGQEFLASMGEMFLGKILYFKHRRSLRRLDLSKRYGNSGYVRTFLASHDLIDSPEESFLKNNFHSVFVENHFQVARSVCGLCKALSFDEFHDDRLILQNLGILRFAFALGQHLSGTCSRDGTPYMLFWAWLQDEILEHAQLDYFTQLPRTDWSGGKRLTVMAVVGSAPGRHEAIERFSDTIARGSDVWLFANAMAGSSNSRKLFVEVDDLGRGPE